MRSLFAILKRSLLGIIRQRSNLLFMIAMPLLFTFMFGVLPGLNNNSGNPIAVVDADMTPVSKGFIEALRQTGIYSVQEIVPSAATETLRNLDASLVLTIPHGFEEDSLSGKDVTLGITPSANTVASQNGTMAMQGQLEESMNDWERAGGVAANAAKRQGGTSQVVLEQAFLDGLQDESKVKPVVSTETVVLNAQSVVGTPSAAEHAVAGFSAMFMMFTIFGAAGGLIEEKRKGTWARIKSSPVPNLSVMTGYGASLFMVGWLQFGIMYLSSRWIFNIPSPMNGWVVLTISLYTLAVCGIALCVAGMAKSVQQHMTTMSLVTVSTCMIGGAYWPIDMEPNWMQHVAWLVPQNWAIDAMQWISLGSTSLSVMLLPITVLIGFAVVFFTAGMFQLRYS